MNALNAITSAVVAVLAILGSFFFLVGTVGVLRLPDFYSRTHAATKCDTVGAGSILMAAAIANGLGPETLKVVAIAGLVLISSPTAGHALARAAYRTGLTEWHKAEREVAR